jgi:hypothetical protein
MADLMHDRVRYRTADTGLWIERKVDDEAASLVMTGQGGFSEGFIFFVLVNDLGSPPDPSSLSSVIQLLQQLQDSE